MNLLFDQNISPRILKLLSADFSESQQVRFVGLENASDLEIFLYVKENNLAVVTFDVDFVDLNAMYGIPPRIIYLNTGNLTTRSIAHLIEDNIDKLRAYINSNSDDILELLR